MSYSFGMFFTAANSLGDAMCTALKYAETLGQPQNARMFLKDNRTWCPTVRRKAAWNGSQDENAVKDMIDDYWLRSVFNLTFVYWPEHKLLGLSGYDYPKAQDAFAHHICFQDSTDQDYEIEEWEGICSFSDGLVAEHRKYLNASVKDAVDWLLRKCEYRDYTDKELKEDPAYYIRHNLYQEIFSALCLDDWLYGRPNESFVRFKLNAITSEESMLRIRSLWKKEAK